MQLGWGDETVENIESDLQLDTSLENVKTNLGGTRLPDKLKNSFVENVTEKVKMYKDMLKQSALSLFRVISDAASLDANEKLISILSEPSFSDRLELFNVKDALLEVVRVGNLFKEFLQPWNSTELRKKVKRKLGLGAAMTATDNRTLDAVVKIPSISCLVQSIKNDTDLKTMFKSRLEDLKTVVTELLSANNACQVDFGNENTSSRYTIESTCAKLINGFAENPKTFREQHLNMVLMGDPGMGKTRYAKLIGRVMKGAGILLSSKPIDVVSRSELVGQYVGQTGPRTRDRLLTNLESVMVLDEAYRLAVRDKAKDNGEGDDDWEQYGNEAIGEIVNFLDKHKGQISIIAAGYEKQMRNDFLKINIGMPRRFPHQIELPAYTAAQLANIFCVFMKDLGEIFTDDAYRYLYRILQVKDVRDQIFPNGAGDIENFAGLVRTTMSSLPTRTISKDMVDKMFRMFCLQTQNKACFVGTLENRPKRRRIRGGIHAGYTGLRGMGVDSVYDNAKRLIRYKEKPLIRR